MLICSNCATENKNGSRFCNKCGTPLQENEQPGAAALQPASGGIIEPLPIQTEKHPLTLPYVNDANMPLEPIEPAETIIEGPSMTELPPIDFSHLFKRPDEPSILETMGESANPQPAMMAEESAVSADVSDLAERTDSLEAQ